MDQTLILVDGEGKFEGYSLREECHSGRGRKHLAFVTVLFDSKDKVILQKRRHKLFDNLWDLTAVSHILHFENRDESFQEASDRTLLREMGINHAPVKKKGIFNYYVKEGENCENEHCVILVGNYDGECEVNPKEVYEAKLIDYSLFKKDIKKNPDNYTPWAVLAIKKLEESL